MVRLINNLFKKCFINNGDGFQRFCQLSLNALNKHSPRNMENAHGNQIPYFNKKYPKAIMTQTKLQNIFLQNRIEENSIL